MENLQSLKRQTIPKDKLTKDTEEEMQIANAYI